MADGLEFYDTVWLCHMFQALRVISRTAPRKLAGFVDAMVPLRTGTDFRTRTLRGILGDDEIADIKTEIRSIPTTAIDATNHKRFGHLSVRNHAYFSALQMRLTERVSELAGETVEANGTCLRLHAHPGLCCPTLESPAAKWTLEIAIDQSEPWPVRVSQSLDWPELPLTLPGRWHEIAARTERLRFASHISDQGDAVLYSASSQWHCRAAPLSGDRRAYCDVLRLHFIPAGTRELIDPSKWPRLFDVPELSRVTSDALSS